MAYRALALSQSDVEELCEVHCAGRFRQSEVEALFKRFRDLDRDHKVIKYATPCGGFSCCRNHTLLDRIERMCVYFLERKHKFLIVCEQYEQVY